MKVYVCILRCCYSQHFYNISVHTSYNEAIKRAKEYYIKLNEERITKSLGKDVWNNILNDEFSSLELKDGDGWDWVIKECELDKPTTDIEKICNKKYFDEECIYLL